MGIFSDIWDTVCDATTSVEETLFGGPGETGGLIGTPVMFVLDHPVETAVTVAAAVTTGGVALAYAPAIGAAVSAAGLGVAGGTLSGAAASSAGLAALGGGSLASGGLGMAGGTAAVTVAGGCVGGGAAVICCKS